VVDVVLRLVFGRAGLLYDYKLAAHVSAVDFTGEFVVLSEVDGRDEDVLDVDYEGEPLAELGVLTQLLPQHAVV